MLFIDTAEQYVAHAATVEPVTIPGKYGRSIPVPCVNTIIVARSLVQANTYNPNAMPDEKRDALEESIKLAGFAYPVAAWWDTDLQLFVIVDGFHRWLITGYDYLGMEYLPVVPLDLTPEQRMMATWTFNKARGHHQVDLDAELIRSLINQGVEEDEIATKLGIDLETVYRYKQVTGIVELFKNAQYSMSWTMQDTEGITVRE
jgi:ParB-like chromosome segregation protein Spo0J